MKKFLSFIFIGILFFSFIEMSFFNFVFASDEYQKQQEIISELENGSKVVSEMKKEDENEKGIYFFDSIAKRIFKFFNYNDEFDLTSTPKITDNGGVAIYSIGDEIFFKESDGFGFGNEKDALIGDFGEVSVNENSVKLFTTKVNGSVLTLNWKDEDVFDGYLIQIKDNIDGFLNGDSKSLVYLLKKEGKNFDNIKENFLNSEKIFLTEKKFSNPELKIFLDEDFFYAKIFGISDGKISTSSVQKILYGNKKEIVPVKNFSKIEKVDFPILIENYLNISDLFFTEKNNGDFYSWDFDGDDIFENTGEKIFLPVQNDIGSFYINLKIKKSTGEEFIKKIQLNFFSPQVFFDKEEDGFIFGHIEPKIEKFPISYVYENEESDKKFGYKDVLTDENGEFKFLKNSEKKSRKIFLKNRKILGEIFLESGSVELKFSDDYGDFLVVFRNTESGKEVIAIIYFSGKIEIYDKNYQVILGNKGNSFYLKKFERTDFYFNF